MRVIEEGGASWICLEVPGHRDAGAGEVVVECNSGADRVEVVLPAAWEGLPDETVARAIAAAAGR